MNRVAHYPNYVKKVFIHVQIFRIMFQLFLKDYCWQSLIFWHFQVSHRHSWPEKIGLEWWFVIAASLSELFYFAHP